MGLRIRSTEDDYFCEYCARCETCDEYMKKQVKKSMDFCRGIGKALDPHGGIFDYPVKLTTDFTITCMEFARKNS